MQAWVLPYLIEWVEQQGVDATPVRRLPGMADLTDPDLRVPEASVEAAWREAASLTHDEAIGIHLAEWLPRGALDLVEYAFRSSPSLATALERLARYGRVLSDRVWARMDASGELLQDRSASVGDVAFFLQYSEPTAFHRAFRRWTGQTPNDFRAAAVGVL